MEVRWLGKCGVKVSALCLGAMNFGNPRSGCDEEESRGIIDAFLDAGGNFIDTADAYSEGRSEEILGRALDGRRDGAVIATKGFFPMVAAFGEPPEHPNAIGATRRHLVEAVEGSLRRLRTDFIDLYQIHNWDPYTPIEETLSTLDALVKQGKIRYAGISNYTAWQIAEARQLCRMHHWEPPVTAQMQYSLICRDIENDVIPVCERYGIGILPWSPLGAGVLTGKYAADGTGPAGARFGKPPANDAQKAWRARYLNERTHRIIGEVKAVAHGAGTTPVAASLAWLLGRPQVASVIIGPKSVKQLEENLASLDVNLSDEATALLDEASAPEKPYPVSFQEMSPRRPG